MQGGNMENGCMDWTQVLTIIFSLAGVIYWFKSDLEKHIQRLDTDIKAHNARTDQLYQMFIDLLKERKNQ
jgi:hypothetical protein